MSTWATKRLDDLIAGAEPPPVIRTMQLGGLDSWGEGWAKKRWEPAPEMLNADGSMFGGLIAALADQVLAFATMTTLPNDSIFRTTNLTVNYYRLGRGAPVLIEAKIISQSRQIIHVRAEFRGLDEKLMAEASAQQVLQALK